MSSGCRAPANVLMTFSVFPLRPLGALAVASAVLSAVLLSATTRHAPTASLATPNDNRQQAGTLVGNTLTLQFEARWAGWKPDDDVDSAATVRAFGEVGHDALIPGPLVRVRVGTTVELSLANVMGDSAIIVRGMRAGTVADDTLHIAAGATRRVRFTPTRPGTYLYWGATTAKTIGTRWGRDGQLTGAIVVDAADAVRDTSERIFVITLLDIFKAPDRPPTAEDMWEVAINGRSWPHTERLHNNVGDTVRWRWLNGSDRSHPMHLHGFHFRVLAKGNGRADTTYAAADTRLAVTEFMLPGSTFSMEWTPTRPGNWLFHCHMAGHITPFPMPADSLRNHGMHDAESHALTAMAGLVLGISTGVRVGTPVETPPVATRWVRVLAQEAPKPRDTSLVRARGFVIPTGQRPRRDSVSVPGTPLVLVRGEATAVTVVNNLSQPTSVHWHGMELTSVYDGVAGWSGEQKDRAPLIAPGDSFRVQLLAPRAGTYIYHTHMDSEDQLRDGLYGPLLVLEPGERFDAVHDRTFVIGEGVMAGKRVAMMSGTPTPAPIAIKAGETYRLRFINIMAVVPITLELKTGGALTTWRRVSKDGAALPPAQRRVTTAREIIGVGETYDVEWTPKAGSMALVVTLPDGIPPITQRIRVRP